MAVYGWRCHIWSLPTRRPLRRSPVPQPRARWHEGRTGEQAMLVSFCKQRHVSEVGSLALTWQPLRLTVSRLDAFLRYGEIVGV